MNAIVVFGEDWGGLPSSTQHLATRLALANDIVWVNSIGLRRPRLGSRDIRRVLMKLRRMIAPARQEAAAVVSTPARIGVVEPRAISWPGSRIAAAFNRRSVGGQVRAALQGRGLQRPVIWASLPSVAPLLGSFGEAAVVYYCGDDFGALAGVDHAAAVAMERDLAARADLIFAASEELAKRFDPAKTVLLPHGVDFELFAKPVPRAVDLPVGKPVAGFYGSIADWVDTQLLSRCAEMLPEWNFVLLGKIETDVSLLTRHQNIHMPGPRQHGDLPSYVQHWDVSMLPFRDTPQIRACNPLKLREYLAAGTPVVATPFPALRDYRDVVTTATGAESFATALRSSLLGAGARADRQAKVMRESWDARAAMVATHLSRL